MELNVSIVPVALPHEIANYEELKAYLTERLEHYSNLVVTKESIQEAKKDRAALNALKTAVDKRRKEVKKEYLDKLAPVEEKFKELCTLIDAPISSIDTQLDVFEEMRKEEKRKEIVEAYDAIVPAELREIIPLERIYSSKWENATMKMPTVEAEIADRVTRTNADMMVLNTIEPEYSLAVREVYMNTFDIALAVAKREALKRAAEAYKQVVPPVSQPAEEKPTEAKIEPQKPVVEPSPEETRYRLCLEFHVTRSQADALKAFLTQNNIKYNKI